MAALHQKNNKKAQTNTSQKNQNMETDFHGATYFDEDGCEITITEDMVSACLEALADEDEPSISSAHLAAVYPMQ